MLSKIPSDHPLRRLFSGLLENVFMAEMGVCNPQLTQYLGGMLIDFVHVDGIYRMKTVDGRQIREISRLEVDAHLGGEVNETLRRQLINRYIGDFTLFWAGVYPEHLRLPRHCGDRLREYLLQGKLSYSIASELTSNQADPPASLLAQLSEEFETCVYGLQRIRQTWQAAHEFPQPWTN